MGGPREQKNIIGLVGLFLIGIGIIRLLNVPPLPMSTTLTVNPQEGISITTDNPILEFILVIGGFVLVYIAFIKKD